MVAVVRALLKTWPGQNDLNQDSARRVRVRIQNSGGRKFLLIGKNLEQDQAGGLVSQQGGLRAPASAMSAPL